MYNINRINTYLRFLPIYYFKWRHIVFYMERTKGMLYGIGTGPGDPELITLKAVKKIQECKYIFFQGKSKEDSLCCKIAEAAVAGLDSKTFVPCRVPMTKDLKILDQAYDEIAESVSQVLDEGNDVAFLTLGDPTVYAAYIYVHQKISARGYEARIINGVPSFCAAAGALGISLAERSDVLHIIPASYDVDSALTLPGTKVLMKSASNLPNIKARLLAYGETSDIEVSGDIGRETFKKQANMEVYAASNCGLADEKLSFCAEDIDENSGYLTLLIVKEGHKA